MKITIPQPSHVSISRRVLCDQTLSLEAKGVYVSLLADPDFLSSHLAIHEYQKVSHAVGELVQKNYIQAFEDVKVLVEPDDVSHPFFFQVDRGYITSALGVPELDELFPEPQQTTLFVDPPKSRTRKRKDAPPSLHKKISLCWHELPGMVVMSEARLGKEISTFVGVATKTHWDDGLVLEAIDNIYRAMKTDPFWKDKPIPFVEVAKRVGLWIENSQKKQQAMVPGPELPTNGVVVTVKSDPIRDRLNKLS